MFVTFPDELLRHVISFCDLEIAARIFLCCTSFQNPRMWRLVHRADLARLATTIERIKSAEMKDIAIQKVGSVLAGYAHRLESFIIDAPNMATISGGLLLSAATPRLKSLIIRGKASNGIKNIRRALFRLDSKRIEELEVPGFSFRALGHVVAGATPRLRALRLACTEIKGIHHILSGLQSSYKPNLAEFALDLKYLPESCDLEEAFGKGAKHLCDAVKPHSGTLRRVSIDFGFDFSRVWVLLSMLLGVDIRESNPSEAENLSTACESALGVGFRALRINGYAVFEHVALQSVSPDLTQLESLYNICHPELDSLNASERYFELVDSLKTTRRFVKEMTRFSDADSGHLILPHFSRQYRKMLRMAQLNRTSMSNLTDLAPRQQHLFVKLLTCIAHWCLKMGNLSNMDDYVERIRKIVEADQSLIIPVAKASTKILRQLLRRDASWNFKYVDPHRLDHKGRPLWSLVAKNGHALNAVIKIPSFDPNITYCGKGVMQHILDNGFESERHVEIMEFLSEHLKWNPKSSGVKFPSQKRGLKFLFRHNRNLKAFGKVLSDWNSVYNSNVLKFVYAKVHRAYMYHSFLKFFGKPVPKESVEKHIDHLWYTTLVNALTEADLEQQARMLSSLAGADVPMEVIRLTLRYQWGNNRHNRTRFEAIQTALPPPVVSGVLYKIFEERRVVERWIHKEIKRTGADDCAVM